MAINFRKITSLTLALIMCLGTFCISAFAETDSGFKSVYPKAYEISGHMVSTNGGANNDIPQTLVIVPAANYVDAPTLVDGWQALYCCDAEQGYDGGVEYKRVNLEDSGYYSPEAADHIRAIVGNSYPFIPLARMKSNLEEKGFKDADKLTRGEVISAVQAAIWYYANGKIYSYSQTFDVATNSQWGSPFHDFVKQDGEEIWWATGKRKFSKSAEVAARINNLRDYLMSLRGQDAKDEQVVITELKILDSIPVLGNNGTYKVALRIQLNSSGSGASDAITLKVTVDGATVKEQIVKYGAGTSFEMIVEAKNGQKIAAEVSGTQVLPSGAYFYEPVDGRWTSQCLVGISSGATPIHAAKSVKLDVGEDPVFGSVTLQKIDLNGNALNGAKFDLYAVGTTDFHIGTYRVDGSLTISNLLPGKYYVKEASAPLGYVKSADKYEFQIDKNGNLSGSAINEEGILSVRNEPFEFRFPEGGASNISYMLIDKEGNVSFVRKIDLNDGDTTAPIIVKNGCVSAMFIKQSTSGMFWFSQKVDAEVVDAVIECLKANNPSYSGHDEDIEFGFGSHDLNYTKKNGKTHTVTYNFYGEGMPYISIEIPEAATIVEEATDAEPEPETEADNNVADATNGEAEDVTGDNADDTSSDAAADNNVADATNGEAEDVTGDNTDDTSSDAAEDATGDNADDTSSDAAEDVTGDNADDTSSDAAEDVIGDNTADTSSGATEDVTDDNADDTSSDAAEDAIGDNTADTSSGATEDVTDDNADDTSSDAAEDVTGDNTADTSSGATEDVTDDNADDTSTGEAENVTDENTEENLPDAEESDDDSSEEIIEEESTGNN